MQPAAAGEPPQGPAEGAWVREAALAHAEKRRMRAAMPLAAE
jgi:hypothetical protein